jgi:hypothetical protein
MENTMESKLLELSYRKKIIEEIKGDENTQRKIVSYKKHQMQKDRFYQYVKEYMEGKLDPETVKELHLFASVNLQRRISKSEASIYKTPPSRKFFINDDEIEELAEIYGRMDLNTTLRQANEAFKYQEQCAIQIYLEERKLKSRVLLPHHYDVVPYEDNPENAMAYIISNFDNTSRDRVEKDTSKTGHSQGDKYRDQINQEIGDVDDQKLKDERFYWWSKTLNFVTNGHGEILDKETQDVLPTEVEENDENVVSPLAELECLPFVDVSADKDFQFWIDSGDVLYDATIMYNVALTSEFQVVEMQGHAQAYYKGDAEHMPESIRTGTDKMIFIPINPQNPVNSEFGFANPGSDLAGVREFRESYLKSFLSSRGLDTSIISGNGGGQTATSGVEKMLQMIEKFEASLEDFSLFKKVELDIARIVACFIVSVQSEMQDGKSMLEDEFHASINEPAAISVNTEYEKPELVKTEMQMLEIADKEIEMQISSRVHVLMEQKGLTKDQAIERLKEVDEFESLITDEANGENTQTEV